MSSKILLSVAVGLVVGAVLGYALAPDPVVLGGSAVVEEYNSTAFQDGLFANEFSQGGGVLSFTATSTQAARTLTQAEMQDNILINIAATNTVALSLTLPATSTMTTLLPDAGDLREWYLDNQNAAATTTTIVAGAGIILLENENGDVIIDGGNKARIECYRQADTNVACAVDEMIDAD